MINGFVYFSFFLSLCFFVFVAKDSEVAIYIIQKAVKMEVIFIMLQISCITELLLKLN